MEFHEKLQILRKQRGLTQEELAERLFVSRTAVSRWESGRGYPGIDSLKAVAAFFSVSIDDLLSGEMLLSTAEADDRQTKWQNCCLVSGVLDCSVFLFLFLPFFGQRAEGALQSVSLLRMTAGETYVRAGYIAVVIAMGLFGILTLALQNCRWSCWKRYWDRFSLILHGCAVLLFIIGRQPYAAALLFAFLSIKLYLMWKQA